MSDSSHRPVTIRRQFLSALLSVSMLIVLISSVIFYSEQKKTLLAGIDAKLASVAALAHEMLPADYHDRITDAETVSDSDFQKIVDENNRLCSELGLEYIWSLMLIDGRIVFTTSTSPDKIVDNQKHAKFFELHSNPELYTNTFATLLPVYKSSHDKWGDMRVALHPYLDSHGRKYLFGASVRMTAVDEQLRKIVWQSIFVGLIVFAFSMVVGFFVADVVTRPLHRLAETIPRIASGSIGVTAEENGTYEQVALARAVNRLTHVLQEKIAELEVSKACLIDQQNVERQQAQDDLVLSERWYRGLMNFAADGILVGSRDGIITDANECMCVLMGLRCEEIIGRHIREMPFTPESVCAQPFQFDLLYKGDVVVKERTIRRRDESEVIVEIRTKMMPDGTLQSIYRDITVRKRVERELRESEDRYRQLFEMESDAIFLVENDTCKILDVNLAVQTMYGYDRSELLVMRNVELSIEPEETERFSQRPLSGDLCSVKIALRKHRKKDGSVFFVEIIAHHFMMKGRSVHIAAIRDITERIKAQELLESWNAELERRVAERTEQVERYTRQLQALTSRLTRVEEDERQRFSDVLHEDLQQVLVAARMRLGAAIGTVKEPDTQEQIKRVDEMLVQSLRLTHTLVQEMAVPAVREGDLPFALGWITQQMQEKFGFAVAWTCDEKLPSIRHDVYVCLFRVIQELLFNVVKHAEVKQATITVTRLGDNYFQLEVADKGCGFAVTKLSETVKGCGGFGLFSIRERIEGLCGSLKVVSEIGQGTVIVLTVPVYPAENKDDGAFLS